MKSIVRLLPVVVSLICLLGGISFRAHASSGVRDTTKIQAGDASFTFWGNQRSNVISTGFARSLNTGGLITHEILDPVLNAHEGGAGYMGGSIGWSKSWTSRPIGKSWAICGSFGTEILYDTRWTSDLFELVWYGNGGHTGRVDDLSGTGVRLGIFNRFSLGVENANTRQRFEVSMVQRLAGAEWSIPSGHFYVSENVDSLNTYIQTEATFFGQIDTISADTASSFLSNVSILPAYGIGISGRIPIQFEDLPIMFDVEFQDIGLLFEPTGSDVATFEGGFNTTGLSMSDIDSFQNLNVDSLVNDILDSSFTIGSSGSKMSLLPYKLSANFIYEPSPKVIVKLSASSGGWMPNPLFKAGVGWNPIKKIAFGVEARFGGWGSNQMRPAVWAQIRYSCRRMLVVEVDDPMGFLLNNELSDFAYGRGITIRLERLAGNGWAPRGGMLKATCHQKRRK